MVAEAADDGAESAEVLPWQVPPGTVEKRTDLTKVVILGAGPIVIGQVRFIISPAFIV